MRSLNMRRYPAAVFAILLFSCFTLFEDPVTQIGDGLKKYLDEYPQEKIYVHHDKPFYAEGEIVWLKVYLTAGPLHQPSPLSQTVLVELIGPSKQILSSTKLKCDEGFAQGSVQLPDSLATGDYVLRAYTPWMTNFDPSFLFTKNIRIWGSSSSAADVLDGKDVLDVQFFPEGGTLLAGLRNRVGFKVTGGDGLGRKAYLRIADEKGGVIAEGQSNILGMGSLYLIPQADGKYYGTVDGHQEKFQIPAATNSGFLLAVTNRTDANDISIRAQSTDVTPNKSSMTMTIHTRGLLAFAARVDLSKNLFITKVSKGKLLPGINTVTLFDSQNNPVAERLVFVEREDGLRVSIKTLPSYKAREKTVVDIEVKDAQGRGVEGNFSMAVHDNEKVLTPSDALTIRAQLLLASDLKGNIERPGYYFNSDNSDRHDALDALMLTQGWRRFTWKNVLSGQWPALHTQIDQGLTLGGQLLDIANGKPIAGGKVVYMQTSTGGVDVQTTDEAGKFRFDGLLFYDTAKVLLQGENKRGNRTVKFKLDEQPRPAFENLPRSFGDLQAKEIAYVQNLYEQRKNQTYVPDGKAVELAAVEITSSRIVEPEVQKMYGRSTKTLKTSDLALPAATHPLELLQGRFAGVQVQGSGLNYQVTIRGVGSINAGNTPLIMVDNIPVDISVLSSYRAQDIESIDVFKGADASVFGSQGANGAILFYTKKGTTPVNSRIGILNVNFGGYSSVREFYTPKYDVAKPVHTLIDQRTTIYWAPVIQTDSTGRATVEYYNPDQTTTVFGLVEGLTATGQSGTGAFSYALKSK